YTGDTAINSGTLIITDAKSLGENSGGTTRGTTTVASGATLEVAAAVNSAEPLTISGTGMSSAGAVNFSAAGTLSGTVAMSADSTVQVASTGTISGIISGVSMKLTKTGAGTLSVSGVNTYSGDTVISAGGLTIATAGTLGGTSPATYAGAISVASGSTLTHASSATQTLSGVISGSGGLTKSTASSTLTLSNTNAYEGVTEITAGKISISSDRNLGAVPGSTVATQLTLNGGTLLASNDVSINSNRGITLGAAGGTLEVDATKTLTAGSIIAGSSGAALTKSGSGTLVLSQPNTYVGVTTVSAGVVQVSNATSLGTSAGKTTISSSNNAAIEVSGGVTVAENIEIQGSGVSSAGVLRSVSGSNVWTGTVTMLATSEIQVESGSTMDLQGAVSGNTYTLTVESVGTSTISGAIGTTTGGLTKTGAGTLTLTAANTYAGATTISAGTLAIGTAGDRISNSSAVSIANSATLALNGLDETVASIATPGDGTNAKITLSTTSATNTLTVGDSTSTTFAGVIEGTNGKLTKQGTGTLTLSGANTYTGATTVSSGTIALGAANRIADTSPVVVANSASFNLAGYDETIASIATSGDGTSSTVTLSTTGSPANTLTLASDSSTTFAGAISGSNGKVTKQGSGTLTLTGTNTFSGALTISAGTVSVGGGGNGGIIGTSSIVNSGSLIYNRTADFSYSGVISGTGSLTKLAAQKVSLTGANTYSGGTTITAGTLSVGAGGAVGAISGNVTNNATLLFDRSDSISFGGTISGTGAVTKSGTNTLTLTANGTYAGVTTISGGTLVLQNDAPSTSSSRFGGAGALTIEPTSTSFTSSFSTTGFVFGNTLTSLTLGKSGNTADMTVATSTVIAGPVAVHGKDIAISAAVTATASTVTLNASGAVTQTAAITGNGLALNGAGAFTLANTSNNVATIAAGSSSARATSVTYRDSNALTIGTVNPTGIWASGDVSISTATEDLTFSESINTTSASATAVTLNAGVDAAAGTSTGGNIIVSGSPTITMGAGGIARLFSGSVDSSTGLTSFVGSGSGRFRYNSDESSTGYTVSLTASSPTAVNTSFAIYRERPTMTVTAQDQTLNYGVLISQSYTVSGKNGDTAAQAFSVAPTISASTAFRYARTTTTPHTLTASAAQDQLGYAISYVTGALRVDPLTLTVGGSFTTQSKEYNAQKAAVIDGNSLTLLTPFSGDDVTLVPVLEFDTANVGSGKTVSLTSSSSL
ncbi:MAG: hypothetical protein RI908_75, partial [Actinomycetota bacterium]